MRQPKLPLIWKTYSTIKLIVGTFTHWVNADEPVAALKSHFVACPKFYSLVWNAHSTCCVKNTTYKVLWHIYGIISFRIHKVDPVLSPLKKLHLVSTCHTRTLYEYLRSADIIFNYCELMNGTFFTPNLSHWFIIPSIMPLKTLQNSSFPKLNVEVMAVRTKFVYACTMPFNKYSLWLT